MKLSGRHCTRDFRLKLEKRYTAANLYRVKIESTRPVRMISGIRYQYNFAKGRRLSNASITLRGKKSELFHEIYCVSNEPIFSEKKNRDLHKHTTTIEILQR